MPENSPNTSNFYQSTKKTSYIARNLLTFFYKKERVDKLHTNIDNDTSFITVVLNMWVVTPSGVK